MVYEKASELLERLPEDYVEDDYKAKLQKLGGLAVPLNIFLFQVSYPALGPCALAMLVVSAISLAPQGSAQPTFFSVSPTGHCYVYWLNAAIGEILVSLA